MKIVTNEPLIQRNKRIGTFITFASLAVLIGGLLISFTRPELIAWSYGALALGFLLSQVGIYFGSRWGRSPRPDQVLDTGLKGLDDKYTLYHYRGPVGHTLVGPSGVWVLLPYPQKGIISFNNLRYKQQGGSTYMKIFGQEGLGRPDLEANTQVKDMQEYLVKHLPEQEVPPVRALLVFTNEKASVDISADAPHPGVHIKNLKQQIRSRAKEKPLTPEQIEKVRYLFGDPEDEE